MATNSADAADDRPREAPETTPIMFPPVGGLIEEALLVASPRQGSGSHRSSNALADAAIMMVDDEALNIEMTQAFLQEAGYRNFMHTSDSRTAIALLHERMPAVLLLDLSMPEVSGMDILNEMREDPLLRHIPVIVLTGATDPQAKLQALAAGAMDFLPKPVDPSELALRLRNTLAATAYRDFLTHHDSLTGLPNRLMYSRYMADVIADSEARGARGAVVHVGVDRLGPVNDALGRAVGDHVLVRLAKRLASSVESEVGGELGSETHQPRLFRFEGDEFAIVLPHVEGEEMVAAFISRLMEEAGCALNRGGQTLFVTCSIGIALFPQDARGFDELAGKASIALRKAKERGPHNYEFFSPELGRSAAASLGAAAELRLAMRHDQIALRFEPCFDAQLGWMVSAQVVPTWLRAGGAIAGDALLDLMASTDLGREFAEWQLEEVQSVLAAWRAEGHDCVPLRISLSVAQIAPAAFLPLARKAVRDGLDPRLAIVEWQRVPGAEELSTSDAQALIALARMDLRIGVGRFGVAAGSLIALAHLPIDQVRLDASLMREFASDARTETVARQSIALAKGMGWKCVVTAVENLHQLDVLRHHGADQYCGPVADQPLEAQEFARKRLAPRRKGLQGGPGAQGH
ncbi:MAG TPA: EAL domain-containing protein [Ramlibacter sp.]|uniref:EAL domain-containing protein n=1 Tax=Ramlibacter sp. TaxID=1917967 RepID=UPI002B7C23D7|nr:EAL domain-containing protein [Ramlibacter sp.]HVZ43500.1 EAL domain-containing protein [Ramlibacter sp.]